MYHLTLEFESEPELRETAQHLLSVHGVTGELACRRLADGVWRLEISAEHQLAESLIQALKGRVIGSAASSDGN